MLFKPKTLKSTKAAEKFYLSDERLTPLVDFLKQEGYTIKFVEYFIHKDKSFVFGGLCNYTDKVISLAVRERPDGPILTIAEVCWYLAHEVRHVIHLKKGLYKSYYSPKYTAAVAYRAENDCNNWASCYTKIAFDINMRWRYPIEGIRNDKKAIDRKRKDQQKVD